MKVVLTFILSLSSTHLLPTQAGSPDWRGVKPLHSTRQDVERLLGQPTEPGKVSARYDLKDAVVRVVFTGAPACNTENGWLIPEGTVTELTVTPKESMTLSDLKINEREYKKTTDPRNPNYVKYTNRDAGRSINVHYGKVEFMTYYPSTKDEYLMCSKSRVDPAIEEALQDLHAVDTYGDIPPEDESARLDNFAINILNDPGSKGYIVTHAGQRVGPDEAQARAERAKSYLTNKRSVRPERIIILTGDSHEEFGIELYVVPPHSSSASSHQ
jgi:hypothetical protein